MKLSKNGGIGCLENYWDSHHWKCLIRSWMTLCQACCRENFLLEWTRWCLKYFLILWFTKFDILLWLYWMIQAKKNSCWDMWPKATTVNLAKTSGIDKCTGRKVWPTLQPLPFPLEKHFWNRLASSFFHKTPFCLKLNTDQVWLFSL